MAVISEEEAQENVAAIEALFDDDDEADSQTSLIIGGEGTATEDIEVDDVPAKPIQQLTPAEQKKLADHIVDEIDSHDEGIPMLPLNLGMFVVWSIENVFLPLDEPNSSKPGVILTFASPENPRGTPFVFTRERALRLASQLKKHAQTGPSLQQRAAQSGITVPSDSPSEGELIVPGR